MPPTDRFVIRFAAEPPREPTPYGRWADTLTAHFLGACHALETEGEDLGEAGDIAWFPDRSYAGRTYVPAVARTTTGYELFGFVSFTHPVGGAPTEFQARADFTSETADSNPDWNLDLNDEVVSSWQGEHGNVADITLIWGVPMVGGGSIVTAELAELAVDQCTLVEERFTLLSADNYRGDYLDIKLWDGNGVQLASEPLWVDDDDADESDGSAQAADGESDGGSDGLSDGESDGASEGDGPR
jgi:hypothetical protein